MSEDVWMVRYALNSKMNSRIMTTVPHIDRLMPDAVLTVRSCNKWQRRAAPAVSTPQRLVGCEAGAG
jgi:hypothetical protein